MSACFCQEQAAIPALTWVLSDALCPAVLDVLLLMQVTEGKAHVDEIIDSFNINAGNPSVCMTQVRMFIPIPACPLQNQIKGNIACMAWAHKH